MEQNIEKILLIIVILLVAIVPSYLIFVPNEKSVRLFQKIAENRETSYPMTCRDIYRNFSAFMERMIGGFIFILTVICYFTLDVKNIHFLVVVGIEALLYFLLSHRNYHKKLEKKITQHFRDVENPGAFVDEVIRDINTNGLCVYRNRFILSQNYLVICDEFGPVSVPLNRIQMASIDKSLMIFLSVQIDGQKQKFVLGRNNNITCGAAEKLAEYHLPKF